MVGKMIANLRKKKGWTQRELAQATRLSTGHIANIEEGARPGIKTMALIAEALGVEVSALYKEW
jgi:transcriptional regulator with XRE-family HTH domain